MLRKLVPSSLFVIIFLFFFSSFLVVSCNAGGSKKELVSFSGFELLENNEAKMQKKMGKEFYKIKSMGSVFGSNFGSFDKSSDEKELIEEPLDFSKANPFLIFVLTMTVLGFLIALIDLPKWAVVIPGIFGSITLVIFKIYATDKINEKMQEFDLDSTFSSFLSIGKETGISIDFTWTFYVIIFLFLIAGFSRYLIDLFENNIKFANINIGTTNKKECHYCKNYIHKDAIVCMYCRKDCYLEPTQHIDALIEQKKKEGIYHSKPF